MITYDILPTSSRRTWYKTVKFVVDVWKGASVLDTVIPFKFSHPAVPPIPATCSSPGECGFLLKHSHYEVKDVYLATPAFQVRLLRDEVDYTGSGVHFHHQICAEDMFFYEIRSFTTVEGEKVCVPDRWRGKYGWWRKWFEGVVGEGWRDRWKVERVCVEYNIRKYLVAQG